MVSIELWMAKIFGFMAMVRSHRRLSNTASLRSELQELKSAISMPAETRPCQKTMDFVNALE